MPESPATIVLADDHPIVRQGFARIIEQDPGFHIVAEAGDGERALAEIHRQKPHIAVLDIAMPRKNGLEIARAMREHQMPCRIVLLTMYRDREYFEEAMSLGIRGYVLKDSAVGDLLACLHTVLKGGHYISPVLSGYLIDKPKAQDQEPLPPSLLDRLTPTEKSILALIAQHKTSRQIANDLFISYRTVQNHRTNMCRKLELKGHNKLLLFALENHSGPNR